ncbi:MAG: hypothetical protein ACREOW_10270 [Thermodesulfobacteriota bacterium]
MQPKYVKLTSVKHIRRLLSKISNDLILGSITPQVANSIAHLCTVLLKTLELTNLEGRLEAVEEALNIDKPSKLIKSDVKTQIRSLNDKTSN